MEILPLFSITISTKNRINDLVFTLQSIQNLIKKNEVECVVYDDGSTDGTYETIKKQFPEVNLLRNEISKGYIYCRNYMLNHTKAKYAISLDDDAHFLSKNPLFEIENHFKKNQNCGLIAFRIFWGLQPPSTTYFEDEAQQVKAYVGCGHAWRMEAWKTIPNYPEWFEFYGEEEFASLQLYKNGWQVHYVPSIFINHRVDMQKRKKNADYLQRSRMSLRSGWYNYFLFLPKQYVIKKMSYSIYSQLKNKIIKGNNIAAKTLLLALYDLIKNSKNIYNQRKKISKIQYKNYLNLPDTKIYWTPK